jgi:hypothetical protein
MVAELRASARAGVLVEFSKPPKGKGFARELVSTRTFPTQKAASEFLEAAGYRWCELGVCDAAGEPARPAWIRFAEPPPELPRWVTG